MMRGLLLFAVAVLIGAAGATADAQIDKSLPTIEASPISVGKHRVFFPPGTDELSTSARKILDYQAATLKEFPAGNFEIVGHTDTHEVLNRDASRGLGYRRAVAVRDYLVSRGVAPHRLRPKSRGYEAVIVLNESDGSMANLRFVSTELLPEDR